MPSFVRGARAFSWCLLKKTHEQHQKYSYSFFKKKLNKSLPGFPPSLRLKELKEPQTKPTSLIPTERLQEITWQGFWRSLAPRGASKNSAMDFCSGDLDGVLSCLCSGKMARWTLPHGQSCYKLFYSTRPLLTLLKSLPCSDR